MRWDSKAMRALFVVAAVVTMALSAVANTSWG
jgi:hypothetical protein